MESEVRNGERVVFLQLPEVLMEAIEGASDHERITAKEAAQLKQLAAFLRNQEINSATELIDKLKF